WPLSRKSVQATCTRPYTSTATHDSNWRDAVLLSLTRIGLVHVSPPSLEYSTQTSSSPSPPVMRLAHVKATYLPVGSVAEPTIGCCRGLQLKQNVPMSGSKSRAASYVAPLSLLRR